MPDVQFRQLPPGTKLDPLTPDQDSSQPDQDPAPPGGYKTLPPDTKLDPLDAAETQAAPKSSRPREAIPSLYHYLFPQGLFPIARPILRGDWHDVLYGNYLSAPDVHDLSGAFGTRDIGGGTMGMPVTGATRIPPSPRGAAPGGTFGPTTTQALSPAAAAASRGARTASTALRGTIGRGPPATPARAANVPSVSEPGIYGEITGNLAGREIVPDITHAIRPPTGGRALRSQQRRQLNLNMRSAIEGILDNEPNLQYRDDTGAVAATGRPPENLGEFAEAITQTKRSIWDRIANVTRRAGQAGVNVDTTLIGRDLRQEANRPGRGRLDPDARRAIMRAAEEWENYGSLSMDEALDKLTILNSELKPWYNNPQSMVNPLQTVINRTIAHRLRELTDFEIDQALAGNPNWAGLRRQHGALSSIERAVNNAAGVEARNVQHGGRGGLTGLAFSFEGYKHIIHALLHMDPLSAVTGGAFLALRERARNLRDPAAAVRRAFTIARHARSAPPTARARAIPLAPDPFHQAGGDIENAPDAAGDIANFIGTGLSGLNPP